MKSSKDRGIELSKNEKQVNTRSFIKQHAPDIQVVDQSNVDRIGGINQSKKLIIKKELQHGNVFHQVQKIGVNPERIIAQSKASPTILAHEIGHHIDRKLHPQPESKLSREINAWRDAPMINNKTNSKIKLDLLRSYIEKNAMSIPLLLKARNVSFLKGLDAAKIDSKPLMAKRGRQTDLFYNRVLKKINKNIEKID